MLGLDIVEIYRIRDVAEKYQDRFLHRVFTRGELDYCLRKTSLKLPELAVRFAAKEAVVKALGTGMRGMTWKEIEVIRNPLGKPEIILHDRALGIAGSLGVTKIHISLSHTKETAAAVAMLEYGELDEDIEEEDYSSQTEDEWSSLEVQ